MNRAFFVFAVGACLLMVGDARAVSTCASLGSSGICSCTSTESCTAIFACDSATEESLCTAGTCTGAGARAKCTGALDYAEDAPRNCPTAFYRCAPAPNINIIQYVSYACQDCVGCVETVSNSSPCPSGQGCHVSNGIPVCGVLAGITSFEAIRDGDKNVLRWSTGSERHNLGFDVYRVDSNGSFTRVNRSLIAGVLNTPVGDNYELVDRAGTTRDRYVLEWVDQSGSTERRGPVSVKRARLAPLAKRFDPASIRARANADREAIESIGLEGKNLKAPAPLAPTAAKLHVRRDGLVRARVGDVAASGLDLVGKTVTELSLTSGGEPVALGASTSGPLSEEDYLEFYGQENPGRQSAENVYLLTVSASDSRPIPQVLSPPAGAAELDSHRVEQRIEEDRIYALSPNVPDGFYWDYLSLRTPEKSFGFEVNELLAGVVQLSGELDGISASQDEAADHRWQVLLNGNLVLEARWDGTELFRFTHEVPASWLLEGANQITLRHAGGTAAAYDTIGLDGFTLSFQRRLVAQQGVLSFRDVGTPGNLVVRGFSQPEIAVYDVTRPQSPRRLNGVEILQQNGAYQARFARPADLGAAPAAFLVIDSQGVMPPERITPRFPTTLRARENGADLLVVAYDAFVPALAPLLEQRRAGGLRVVVATTTEIFDEFGHGNVSDQAIKDFLAFAHREWTAPAPQQVLLVGDTTNDPRDLLQLGLLNYVPSHLVDSSLWGGTTSDNWYGDLDGDGTYELSMGRLPVSTPAQAEALVAKLVGYGEQAQPESALRRIVFIADRPEAHETFEAMIDTLAALVPPDYETVKIRLAGFQDKEAARAKVLEELGKGSLLVVYVGHGSGLSFGRDAVFTANDIEALPAGKQLPLVLSFSCVNGYFGYPGLDILGEALVKPQQKGAIGSWMPADLGLPVIHEQLAVAFLERLFASGKAAIGGSIRGALNDLVNAPAEDEQTRRQIRMAAESFAFMGDPSLSLPLEAPSEPAAPDAGIAPASPDAGALPDVSPAGLSSCGGCNAGQGFAGSVAGLLCLALLGVGLLRRGRN